ncbi:MAG: Stp1/IreP family PP2C-type Ser/Thr phosphatase, partial [Chloroflexi bacterium]|nr:Stp1/IreP family PP2C-type Ser/Thr phosphatase [Chloroflexota bacterium]
MAARLQMKLGVIAETDRLEDSPDAVVVVEPTIGATLRSKGSLYLIVSAGGISRRLTEATRLVADTVQGEYYYDESAGVGVCLQKAVRTASRRLAAQRDRLGLGSDGSRPVGLVAAVVRGNELYVVSTGPAEAYLVRQAHLLTLPDVNRGPGLPDDEHVPAVWRGEISVGDSVILVSSNIAARLGPDELKDAVVTLHPQAAMEHLHRRFVAAGGSGSDGALALEAAEVSATARGPKPVAARPAEPLAGQPDRSPIPLADSVGAAGAAVSGGASRAKAAAGGAAGGILRWAQDLLPRRGPIYRRVTPAASRRDAQRRAAVGALLFVGVLAALGLGAWWLGGRTPGPDLPGIGAGEKALAAAREDVQLVFDNGSDLVVDDPRKAKELLLDAHDQLGLATEAGIPATATAPLLNRVVGGLDRLWGMVDVAPREEFSFAGQDTPFDLAGLARGPDGAPYVLDR